MSKTQSIPVQTAHASGFGSTEDLLRSLLGRRVALVGNATPTREFGHLIDRYDVVIRMNNFRLKGFEKLAGTRTDFRCTTGHCDIEHRNAHLEFSPFTATAIESAHLAGFNKRNQHPLLTASLEVHPFIPETPKPSTGLALVQLAAQVGLQLDLFGFDGFKTPHYWDADKRFETTHGSAEFEAILNRPNVLLFGETYPYAELYDFCHANHKDYDHNAGLELTRRLHRAFAGQKVIEFGAGNGDLSRHLESTGNQVTAIEVSAEAFAKITCGRKILGDAFSLAELEEPFDLFASIDVLEHLTENDIRLVLREAGRLAGSLYLSVSTRPSGLLGPKGENLHLTVRPADWWMEQAGRYFNVELSHGYGEGQIVLEGQRKPSCLAAGFTISAPENYCLKPGYQSRSVPEYFEDSVTDENGIVWQPDVYPLAAAIARRLAGRRIIDLGCGRAHKLLSLAPEFEITGVDFGKNIEFCRVHHKTRQWLEANFEEAAPLPFTPNELETGVVICSDVIEHMIHPEALLARIRHLLEHALVAVISTPERELTWGADHAGPPPNPCHTREWNLAEFTSFLQTAGLQVEYTGVTRSHDRDPACKTILAIVSNLHDAHLRHFAGENSPLTNATQQQFRRWLAGLNGETAAPTEVNPSAKAAPIDLCLSSEQPLVSVIVPTYNRPDWLGETLQSILAQTYRNFEIVVVNDAGPDVRHIIEPLNAEGRIRLITHDRNKGLAAARNTGIRAARGECIAYLDDDDIFHPNHLETLVAFMHSSGAPVVYSDAYRAVQREENGRYLVAERDIPYSHDWDNDRILVQNFVPVLCFLHKKECAEKAGLFDESLTTHEDWDLWIRMSRLFSFSHVKQVTCEFRSREDGSSMTSGRRADFLRTAGIIYKKYEAAAGGRPEIAWRRQQHLLEVSHSLPPGLDRPTPDCLLVSIVIPVFNRLDMTRPCLEAIHRETAPGTFEIIVVDNASDADTRAFLEAEQAAGRLRLIRNETNLGFSKACNQGIQAAWGGFVLLLNNDTVPLPGWLEPLLREFLIHSKLAAAGSSLLYPDGARIQHAGVRIGAGGGLVHPYHLWRLQPLEHIAAARKSRDCQAVTGACLLLRRSVLDEGGGLDEGFINGFEDIDLCFRIGQAGYRIRYCAESRLIHHESMTPGRNLHEITNFNRLNERWKSIIKPDEPAEATAANFLEMQCEERLLTEPANPNALSTLMQIWERRRKPGLSAQYRQRFMDATQEGKSIPISVSIIIPVLDNLELTKQCLAALSRPGGLTTSEIIVVDNASSRETADFLRQLGREGGLRLIRNETNLGFAHACNQGAAIARGRFVLFLNNDTVPTAGWLDPLVVAAHRPDVGIAGAKLLYPNRTIQHAGIGWMNGVPDHPGRHSPANAPEVNVFRELDMVTGACLLIHRALFLQLGGFDEAYRNGVEDIDLCLRARAAGLKVVYEPKSVVFHLEGQSSGRFAHVKENLALFFKRWSGRFDAEMRFKEPRPIEIIQPLQSHLAPAHAPAAAASDSSGPFTVSWEGSFLDLGSLSHLNREMTRPLQRDPRLALTCVNTAPVPKTFFPDQQKLLAPRPPAAPSITVRLAWPPDWRRPSAGKLVIMQPWEFGALPVDWVKRAADVDEFWVPTSLVQRFYIESGIPAPKVKVIPCGIDPERFHPGAKPKKLPSSKSFKFLFVGGTIARKGADLLLKAYLEAFSQSDDVCLVIKDFGGGSFYKGQTLADEIQRARLRPDAPEILHIDEEIAPEELPGIYTACDCLVHPYRGEGFGLPVLEAMACGLPVIVTGGGAADDFAADEFAIRLPATRKYFGRRLGAFQLASEGWLLEPDSAELVRQMKMVVRNPEAARAKAAAASTHARNHWTWQSAAETALDRLVQLNKSAEQAALEAVPARAVELPPAALAGSLAPARQCVAAKKWKDAWAHAAAAIEKRPFHPEAFLLLAEIAAAAGEAEPARNLARRASALAPGWKAPRKFLRLPVKSGFRADWPISADSSRVLDASSRPRLTVCIIAKDEEKFLDQCLASISGLAAQVILVDTGSADRTIEIARSRGAEVFSHPWSDDFSAARNAALERASGDWILVLDADEELPPEQHAALLKDMSNPRAAAYRLPMIERGRGDQRFFVPRLFRNLPGAHFEGRIHEQLLPSLTQCARQWGVQVLFGSAELIHHGYSEQLTHDRKKIGRNIRLLRKGLEEKPDDINLRFNLGFELSRSGDLIAGLEHSREAFRMASLPSADLFPEFVERLLTQYAAQLYNAREHAEILQVLSSPLASRASLTASLHFAAGLAHFALKQYSEAAARMKLCIASRGRPALSPINPEILTAAPRHLLALSLDQTGDAEAADAEFRAALQENGPLEKARLDYARFLARQKRPVEALQILHQSVTQNAADEPAWRLGGRVALSQPEFLEFAADWTAEAVKHCPDSPEILAQRAEALLFSGSPEEAAVLLLNGSALNPARKALLLMCHAAVDSAPTPLPPGEQQAVSREFFSLYRRVVDANAVELVHRVNRGLRRLEPVLPEIVKTLRTALSEAGNIAA